MSSSPIVPFDPNLDLLLDRVVDVPRALVWKAWTTPEIVKQWFAPRPWTTVECEFDLRPGGIMRTVMRSPEGQDFPGVGCYLEVVEEERLVWTSVLGPGYRPNAAGGSPHGDDFGFTAIIQLEDHEGGTRYRALVRHGDPGSREKHEAMGFHTGWSAALDQLVALMKVAR
jgi:uncharacterized protein YndB with AHSA1/START domain